MDLENEINIGDYVQYKHTGDIVRREGIPVCVVGFEETFYGSLRILYQGGHWDSLESVRRADPLILELL
jgi:hypothetical protein